MGSVPSEVSKYMGNAVKLADIWGSILYNVKAYGAIGDGITDDTTKIAASITAATATGGIVMCPPGTYITGNLTVPSNVTLWFANGAKLSISSGATMTINGPIMGELTQIFSGLGTATGFKGVSEIYPQWWGAIGDGATDSTSAFQKAIVACPAGGKIFVAVPSSFYLIKGTLTINKSLTIAGDNATDDQNGGGLQTRILFFENSYATAINITASGVKITDLFLQYPGGGSALQNGITADGMLNITLDRVWFRNFKYPVLFTNCIQCNFRQVNIRDCDIGFRFETLGTSMYLENCWVQSAYVTGYQIINHAYCTFVNCLMDGLAGTEPDYAFKVYTSNTMKFLNCASERVKKSHFYLESCTETSLDSCFGFNGNISTSYSASFAYMAVAADNIVFNNCKDYQPLGSNQSVTNATTSAPIFISCDFPNKYSDLGTLCTIQKNSVNIGLASLNKDGVTVLSPDGSRHKIVVSNANVISASTVTG